MYNLSIDEISMVDGGGDGNSSGYPASPGSNRPMSQTQGAATVGAAAAWAGAFAGCMAATGGLGAIGCGAAVSAAAAGTVGAGNTR
ncbi:hypothetical protein BS333_16195 [Vibrio azureus]|uniref:Bacteriocin n=1 Tax=Vibrio azureus NBRC 104587 TaxID=1219077 RepID=U3A8T9_9VIBR|nr:hypothetical protein [Vibrio azureus]AUI87928.1 hypothetical protein BS333_16195 [Vibrio azureus]GAD76326.1 hypothetical protein VAZ01S_041_00270 [Vibrio azureus NBRC 104587]